MVSGSRDMLRIAGAQLSPQYGIVDVRVALRERRDTVFEGELGSGVGGRCPVSRGDGYQAWAVACGETCACAFSTTPFEGTKSAGQVRGTYVAPPRPGLDPPPYQVGGHCGDGALCAVVARTK
jgi:hypothetical protein